MWVFSPNCVSFDENFPTRRRFSNNFPATQNLGEDNYPLVPCLPCRDATVSMGYDVLQFAKTIDSDQLSYYVRVFGNDIRAGDIYQFNTEAIRSRFNFLDWMIELSNERNIDVIKNWQFLDTSLTIPTGTGQLSPLHLCLSDFISV